jgi:hypothetical protein
MVELSPTIIKENELIFKVFKLFFFHDTISYVFEGS